MASPKLSAILLILFLFATPPILSCNYCSSHPHKSRRHKPPKKAPPISPKPPLTPPPATVKPPINTPPITTKPPTLPPPVTVKPPITTPPVTVKPPIITPPVIVKPPGTPPPVIVEPPYTPPITVKPPITTPPVTVKPPFSPPGCTPPPLRPPPATCPVDALKLGACVDMLGGLVHVGLGVHVADECCPLIQGLADIQATLCLCNSIRMKLLNLKIFVPLALKLLVTCGMNPPPDFACPMM
ncbi:hypothetical protein AMTRI_Chr13g89240 [Amborella trichopoda]